MQLNPDGRTRFQAHLEKVLRQPCSVCGSGNWQIEDAIFELREFAGGGLAAGGAVKPVVSMTCTNCGHVLFMSPLTTGIVQLQQPQGSSSEMPGVDAEDGA
jgi:hypothetical protein